MEQPPELNLNNPPVEPEELEPMDEIPYLVLPIDQVIPDDEDAVNNLLLLNENDHGLGEEGNVLQSLGVLITLHSYKKMLSRLGQVMLGQRTMTYRLVQCCLEMSLQQTLAFLTKSLASTRLVVSFG